MIQRMIASLMENGFNEFTLLTEHENDFCYELANISIQAPREEVRDHFTKLLRQFNMQYFITAKQYLDKDKSVYDRMVKIQLSNETNDIEKEFYTRLFRNLYKAKSKPLKIIVTPVELLQIQEGQLLS